MCPPVDAAVLLAVCVLIATPLHVVAGASLRAVAAGGLSRHTSFEAFAAHFNRSYSTGHEMAMRRGIYAANMHTAAALMARHPHAEFGATPFADLSAEEFHAARLGVRAPAVGNGRGKPTPQTQQHRRPAVPQSPEVLAVADEAPLSIDWREHGAVTSVKNQGTCGSCFAFAAMGNIEGQWFLAGHPLASLSEQMIVSCDTFDDGCNGGEIDTAYEWILRRNNGSVFTETSVPYVSGSGNVPSCAAVDTHAVVGATISAYADLPHDETALAAWLGANGPVATAVDATSWQMYIGGILTDCVSVAVNHGVLLVGYDTLHTPPYWIIKNSWSMAWGEMGYIRVAKGSNECLLANSVTTASVAPTVAPPPAVLSNG